MRSRPAKSPLRVFALLIAVIFAVELAIMVVIERTSLVPRDGWIPAILDATVLATVLCPVMWVFVVKPLQQLGTERGALLGRAVQAQEEERARLARELHDDIGQAQTALVLGLRGISDARSLDQARGCAHDLQQIAAGAVDATRRMARGLAPGVLHDLGLKTAVERLCEDMSAVSGVDIGVQFAIGDGVLDDAVQLAAFRIVQEALTNAAKHAHATRVDVRVWRQDLRVHVRITDNGSGFKPPAKNAGLGVAGMRERAQLLGGEFHVTTGSDGGTVVTAAIPALDRA